MWPTFGIPQRDAPRVEEQRRVPTATSFRCGCRYRVSGVLSKGRTSWVTDRLSWSVELAGHELPLWPLSLWPAASNSRAGVRQQHLAQLGLRSDHDGAADYQQMRDDENSQRWEQFHCVGVRCDPNDQPTLAHLVPEWGLCWLAGVVPANGTRHERGNRRARP